MTITTLESPPAQLLTPEDVSNLLGVPIGTLANWRYLGRGPLFVRLGRHVRYRSEDLDTWIEGCTVSRRRDVIR